MGFTPCELQDRALIIRTCLENCTGSVDFRCVQKKRLETESKVESPSIVKRSICRHSSAISVRITCGRTHLADFEFKSFSRFIGLNLRNFNSLQPTNQQTLGQQCCQITNLKSCTPSKVRSRAVRKPRCNSRSATIRCSSTTLRKGFYAQSRSE